MEFQILLTILLFCAAAVFTAIDVGVDSLLVKEHHDRFLNETGDPNSFDPELSWTEVILRVDPQIYLLYERLTILWIASGGCVQFAVVVFLLIRRDPSLDLMPKPIRIVLLAMAAILMGPVVVNLYAALFVLRNAKSDNIQADISK